MFCVTSAYRNTSSADLGSFIAPEADMKSLTFTRVLLLVFGVLLVIACLFQNNPTTSQAQTGTSGRFLLHSAEVVMRVPSTTPQGAIEKRPFLFRIDTHSGEAWTLD